MFVYLLGAGASCKSLPLVKDFSARLAECGRRMRDKAKFIDTVRQTRWGQTVQAVIGNFADSLDWLSSEASRHVSIDTLAKKFYIARDMESLLRLSRLLTN